MMDAERERITICTKVPDYVPESLQRNWVYVYMSMTQTGYLRDGASQYGRLTSANCWYGGQVILDLIGPYVVKGV